MFSLFNVIAYNSKFTLLMFTFKIQLFCACMVHCCSIESYIEVTGYNQIYEHDIFFMLAY